MRIGTIVLVLVAIIMGFGFLFSNNINLQQDLQAAQNRINETMQQNKLLEEQLNNEMAKNAMLQKATESLSQQKLLLDAQVRQMQAEDAQLKDQNAQLQNQINTAVAISPLLTILRNINARALVLGLFVPLLPISLAGNLLIHRNRKSPNQESSRKYSTPNCVLSMQVTEEEMQIIRRRRRHRE